MGLSTAEKNKQKRERKKLAKAKERQRLLELEKDKIKITEDTNETDTKNDVEIEIEYVDEPLSSITLGETNESGDVGQMKENGNDAAEDNDISAVLQRFHARASTALVSDDDEKESNDNKRNPDTEDGDMDYEDEDDAMSKRKLREISRPTVAQLKNRVERADLVEAHDVTSRDPDFLLFLKSVPSTVPVPRHWGRKRKYLQGKVRRNTESFFSSFAQSSFFMSINKLIISFSNQIVQRGIEKAPFQLPDFIANTGISTVRSAIDEDEGGMNAKRKNRNRVAPKMGALDVDYRTLHDAFFKHQNKASIQEKLTKFGNLYYEGKEFETQKSSDLKVGGPLSERLRDALGMSNDVSPSPWLINMQRYGPPPSYPNLKIPGLNAPLPKGASFGYHLNGWGKPPVDNFGRPLFGGNPFDPPGNSGVTSTADWDFDAASGAIVTSDGKTVGKKEWGALPMGIGIEEDEESSSEEESSDEESSDDEMMESEEEEGEEKETTAIETSIHGIATLDPGSSFDLRKQDGDETPAPTKQLYTILQQTAADKEKQSGAVFASDVAYTLPGSQLPEGARSVLSKTPFNGNDAATKKRKMDEDEEDDDLGKKYKF